AVAAGGQEAVLGADVDAQAAVVAPDEVRLGHPVAPDLEQLEADAAQPALGILEAQGEVAIDAVPDLATLGMDDDRLPCRQLAAGGDLDHGVEALDDLGGAGGAGRGGQGEQRRREERCLEERPKDAAPARRARRARRMRRMRRMRRRRRAPHDGGPQDWNETSGTARLASSVSKKARFEKPNRPATRLLGKDSTRMLRSRVAPL